MELFHDKMSTGGKQGSYVDNDGQTRRVQPDIYGRYKGQLFVIDTKLKEKSYVDRRDVDKLRRDAEVLGAKPLMVHSGDMISQVHTCVLVSGVNAGNRCRTKTWKSCICAGGLFSLYSSSQCV